MKTLPVVITAVGLEFCFWLLGQAHIPFDVPRAIRLVILSHLFYLVSLAAVVYGKTLISRRLCLSLALVFRLTMLGAAPRLSDDVYRYRWEGRVQAEGGNPYLLSPAATARDVTYDRIPTREARSGYGPLVTLAEWAGYETARRLSPDPQRQAAWMKLPAVLADLAALALLSRSLPAAQLLVYAWSPLPVIEFWWSGHNDALPVFLIAAALALARRDRWPAAHAALGLAIAAKWWPAVLWPLFALADRKRSPRWAWLEPVAVAVCAIPYVTDGWRTLETNARYMSGFVGGWRNNDSFYGLLLWLTGDQYRAKYMAFAIVAAAVAWFAWRRWPLDRAALGAVAVLLAVAANCHPWYLSWFLPMLPLVTWPPVLLWQMLMPLAYTVLIEWQARGEWQGVAPVRWWIYGPVYASMLLYAYRSAGRAAAASGEEAGPRT